MTIEKIQNHQDLRSKPLNDRLELDLAARTALLLGLENPIAPRIKILSNNAADPGSITYMRNKSGFGWKVGAEVDIDMFVEPGFDQESINLGPHGATFYETTDIEAMIEKIEEYVNDPSIHVIMTQLPLLNRYGTESVIAAIDPAKDGDGLRPADSHFLAATPLGAIGLLADYGFHYAEDNLAVVGAGSETFGKPLINYRKQVRGNDEGVYPIEIGTKDRARIDAFNRSDIIIGTSRKPGAINSQLLAKRLESTRPLAIIDASGVDVSDELRRIAPEHLYITPKLGGLGPATIRMLLGNTVLAAERVAKIDRHKPILGNKPGKIIRLPGMPFDADLLQRAA